MRLITYLSFILVAFSAFPQNKTIIYCFSGQGSNHQIFQELDIDTSEFELFFIDLTIPDFGMDMSSYARSYFHFIDTTHPYCLLGVSLGGMIITEMMDYLHPKKAIIVSSAKCRDELPWQYRIQRLIPINTVIPSSVVKWGAFVAQPIFEQDRSSYKEIFVDMLKSKKPIFYKRTIDLIVNWSRDEYNSCIIHIHGNNDNTLPIKNINATIVINGGSHMMLLTKHQQLENEINKQLKLLKVEIPQ